MQVTVPCIILPEMIQKKSLRYPTSGLPIGVEKNRRWKNNKIQLQSNDLIVLYTDGIIEAENKRGGFFGENKFDECILNITSIRQVMQAI